MSVSGGRTVVVALLCGLAALFASPDAGAVTPPSQDPFYAQPPGLASVAPGTVLRSRQVTTQGATQAASSAVYQLLYRTTDAKGQPIAAVATLMLPSSPAAGPRKLLSYQTYEDSLTTNCAPSYTMRGGSNGGSFPVSGTESAEQSEMAMGLQQGWDVVVPDYEGPMSEQAVGPLEGRTALDSIRAVESFAPSQLEGTKAPVVMMGYSGGSIPTLWANALVQSYAPEVNLVGTATGGNVPDVYPLLPVFDGSAFSGATIGLLVSFNRAYPELGLSTILNASGKTLAAQDDVDQNGCGGSIFNAPYESASQWSNYSSMQQLMAVPRVREVFSHLDLIPYARLSAPAYVWNAINDELAATGPVDQFVATDCAAGSRIDYYRSPTGEHVSGMAQYVQTAFAYLEGLLAGGPVTNTCAAPAHAAPQGSQGGGPPPQRGCPYPSGRLTASGIGLVRLGMTRAAARHAYRHSQTRGRLHQDFFCLTPSGIRVGYASPSLVRGLPRAERTHLRGRVVWTSTSDPFYALRGIRPGARLASAARRMSLGRGFHIGANWWYVGRAGEIEGVLKVRRGVVEEIGIADARLTTTRAMKRRFLTSFN